MSIPQPSFDQMKGYHFPVTLIKKITSNDKLYSYKAMIDIFNNTVNYYEKHVKQRLIDTVSKHKLELDSIKKEKNKIIQDNNETYTRTIDSKDALIARMRTEIGSLTDRLTYVSESILDGTESDTSAAKVINNKSALTCIQVKIVKSLITDYNVPATVLATLLKVNNSTISKMVNNKTYKEC